MTKYRVEIGNIVLSPAVDKLVNDLSGIFYDNNISVKVDPNKISIRNLEPLHIALFIGGALVDYALGKYIFDPAFQNAERLVKRWIEVILSSQIPKMPLKLEIKFDDVLIETFPYLEQKMAAEIFMILGDALKILQREEIFKKVTKIRVVSVEIDLIKVIVYQTNKPSHYIDLEMGRVIPISLNGNDKLISELENSNAELEFRSRLYKQIMKKP